MISATAVSTALSMPRLTRAGFAPTVMCLSPSAKMASARTAEVVVPSPATSFVLSAAAFASFAPMFSNGSSSSTSLETVTPSLVARGDPCSWSRMTFRPLGPSVTFTAPASFWMPVRSLRRASSSNMICLAMVSP